MKKLLLLLIAVSSLTSCSRSYVVRDLSNNNEVVLFPDNVGYTIYQKGDTIRTKSPCRDKATGFVYINRFEGVVKQVN